jgi:hypothetical protein
MPLLIAASGFAAAASVAMLPSPRARAKFALCGGFWFLFPGVDALGVLCVALASRSAARRWWLAATATHLVAAWAAIGVVLHRRRPDLWAFALAFVVAVAFIIDHAVRLDNEPVAIWAHALFLTRYFVVASYLWCSRVA